MHNILSIVNPLLKSTDIHLKKYSPSVLDVFSIELKELIKCMENATYYVFDQKFYAAKSYYAFMDEINSIITYKCGIPTLNVISGKAGIGKTTFFQKKLHELIEKQIEESTQGQTKIDVSSMFHLINFRTRDQDKEISFYQDMIMDEIYNHALDRSLSRLNLEFTSFVEKTTGIPNLNVSTHFNNYDLKRFALAFFLTSYSNQIRKPIIYIVDNLDLCSKKTQRNVAFAVGNVFKELKEVASGHCEENARFALIVVKRPETTLFDEVSDYELEIEFPLPNLGVIFVHCLVSYLNSIVDGTPFSSPITLHDSNQNSVIVNTRIELAVYIREYMKDMWQGKWDKHIEERFGEFNEFHNNIVNSNVRRFTRFLAYAIYKGGLEFLNDERYSRWYTIHDYIRLLITGPYEFHPGNKKMDGEGLKRLSPIVMNLFDYSSLANDKESIIDNYLIYIRILQYLELKSVDDLEVSLENFIDDLSAFYVEEKLITALRKLLFANVVTETSKGIRNLAFGESWRDINISYIEGGNDILISTDGGSTMGFYLKNLVVEYEYLSQISISTNLVLENNDSKSIELINKINKATSLENRKQLIYDNREEIVFIFIKSMFYAIIENLETYKTKEIYIQYRNIFCPQTVDAKLIIHPWRRTMNNFLNILSYKIKSYTTNFAYEKADGIKKLLSNCEDFNKYAIATFKSYKI